MKIISILLISKFSILRGTNPVHKIHTSVLQALRETKHLEFPSIFHSACSSSSPSNFSQYGTLDPSHSSARKLLAFHFKLVQSPSSNYNQSRPLNFLRLSFPTSSQTSTRSPPKLSSNLVPGTRPDELPRLFFSSGSITRSKLQQFIHRARNLPPELNLP